MNTIFARILAAAAFIAAVPPAVAADPPAADPAKLPIISPVPAVKKLQHAKAMKAQIAGAPDVAPPLSGPALKTFPYSVISPRDGNTYTGSIVGADPRNNGARSTNIPVVLIPLRVEFTGTIRNLDPTKPDVGCLGAGHSAFQLSMDSPLFTQVNNYMINGVNMGNTTFIDAFQRAQFWHDGSGGPLVSAKPAYHLGLAVAVAPVQKISMVNDPNGHGTTFGFNGDCSTNPITADNPPRTGFVDINYMDDQLNAIIANLGLNPSQFPLFITYNVYMTDGPPGTLIGNCCILGYHNGSGDVNNPGQTYGIAAYDKGFLFGNGVKDVAAMSHEILEWVNDPSTNNLTPPWGNIGQVGGCHTTGTGADAGQNNLETGDPLSGALMPPVTMPNGVTYHAQENAFFSWFLGPIFQGAGGKYSSNGTFGGWAKPCPPGGSYQ